MAKLSKERLLGALLDPTARAFRSRPELVATALRAALALGEAAVATLCFVHGRKGQRLTLRPDMALPDAWEWKTATGETHRLLSSRGQTVVIPDLSKEFRVASLDLGETTGGPGVLIPLRLRENERGLLAVQRAPGRPPFCGEDVQRLTLVAAWTAMALENRRLAESVEKLAITDDLTQVFNYRFLKTALRREIKRAARFRQELSIIMVDVDNLKRYNDRHGHVRGSFLLREMAALLTRQVRSWDLVAKYGGDEFTVILPQTGQEGAMTAAERLRSAVAGHAFPLAVAGEITISLGVAVFPRDADAAGSLIPAADRALYRAKKNGRNRVEVLFQEAA